MDSEIADLYYSIFSTDIPEVNFTDITENLKNYLMEYLVIPMKYRDLFQEKKIRKRNVLLYGSAGVGKTFIAKAAANEIGVPFFSFSCYSLVAMCKNEDALNKVINFLFIKAREKTPSIIFLDDIDGLTSEEERSKIAKIKFLIQIKEKWQENKEIYFLAASVTPWKIDPMLRKIFEVRIWVPLPDYENRFKLMNKNLLTIKHKIEKQDVEMLAKKLEGFSVSDIMVFLRDVSLQPIRKIYAANNFMEIFVNEEKKYVIAEESKLNEKSEVIKINLNDIDPNSILTPEIELVNI